MSDEVRVGMWSGPRNISTAMMRAFENRPDAADKHLLLDVKSNVYGLAFHPKAADNGSIHGRIEIPARGFVIRTRSCSFAARPSP